MFIVIRIRVGWPIIEAAESEVCLKSTCACRPLANERLIAGRIDAPRSFSISSLRVELPSPNAFRVAAKTCVRFGDIDAVPQETWTVSMRPEQYMSPPSAPP